jgi:hypothetical protein
MAWAYPRRNYLTQTFGMYIYSNNAYIILYINIYILSCRWMTQDELDSFDYKNPPVDGSTGWSFEVNLHYPKELHGKTAHQTFPLAAETRTLTKDDLSETSKRIFCQLKKIDENKNFAYSREKLISSFHDREKYITSHHNLKFFLDNGLVMKGPAVRGITYTEKSIFKPHIDRCSTLRANASSKFMQRVLKLMSNVRILVYIHSCFPRSNIYTFLFVLHFQSIYGKCLEDSTKYIDTKIISTAKRMRRLVQNPNLQSFHILGPKCVIVHLTRSTAVLDRCYSQGFAVLEASKLHMLRTYYEDVIPYLGEDTELLMTDTDSWCLRVRGKSQHDVLSRIKHIMDFSNYHPKHKLYDSSRKSVPGYFKVIYFSINVIICLLFFILDMISG